MSRHISRETAATLVRRPRYSHMKPGAGPLGCADPSGPALRGGPQPHVALGGYAMRTFDLAPLYRSTVGFDRLFSLLDQVGGLDGASSGYPPYNIERTDENAY